MGAEKKMSLKSQHNEDVYVEAWWSELGVALVTTYWTDSSLLRTK